jgi:putative aldouronate transport system substrate-binding protein
MKKNMLVVLLCCIFVTGVFAGGRANRSTGGSARTSVMTGKVKGALPIADGTVTLTMFVGALDSQVTSYAYEDNLATRKFVDETGIKLEIISALGADVAQRRNLLLGSGDYPEVFFGGQPSRDFMTYNAAQGIFIPLNDYPYLEYPRIKAIFEDYPASHEQMSVNGKLYGMPYVNDCVHCQDIMGRGFIYLPWLRESNIPMPQTLAEYTGYLRYIRDHDMNGNGDPNDEIPLLIRSDMMRYAISWFAKMHFRFTHTMNYWGLGLDDNGNVEEQYKDPRFRETLKFLNGLYKEGLFMSESFTLNHDQTLSLFANPDPIVGSLSYWQHLDYAGTQERSLDYRLIPVLAGPTGQRNGSNRDPWGIIRMGMFVTDKCKDPELALAFYDYMLRQDAFLSQYVGPKGVRWDDPDPGAVSLSGGKPLYKYLSNQSSVNSAWSGHGNMGQTLEFRLGQQVRDFDAVKRWIETGDPSLRAQVWANPDYAEIFNYLAVQDHIPYWIPGKYYIPPVSPSPADVARIADINATLETYLDQSVMEFILGGKDINSDAAWNTYLNELDRLGSADRAAIYQKLVH